MLEFKYIKNKYWQAFVLSFILALLLLLPISLRDAIQGNVFHYAGDYNSQSLLFWQYANKFIKSGGTFSWVTELGSGFVNSYSYYMLGSPFFWASLWVPAKWMPWAMVPLFCFKFAVAGAGGYLWSKRWVKNLQYALLAGILYAFCGYNIYSIFYDSFIDVTALFPYMLAALDDAIIDNKKARFPIWVALCLLVNYYFFIGEAIFLIIYFVCMLIGKNYKLNAALFGRMAIETILGVAIGSTLLIPAILSLSQNPRTSAFLNDYEFITYNEPQKYMAILASMFIMPDAPYQNTLFSNSGTQWQNVCAYLPVVGITGGIALCRANRKHSFARLLMFCAICAFVPMLNAMFTLENSAYYARWYFMPILVLCGVTGMVLEDKDIYQVEWWDAWKTVLIVTAAFVALELVPSDVPIMGFKLEVPPKLQHFQKFLFRSRKAVPVAISPRVRKSIEKRYGMNINEIPMIYNGIDVNNFSPKDDYAQHDVFTCLHIGRFSEQKNHIEMVLALKKLIDAGEKIRFIFVGEGDLLGDIKEQVDKQHLTKYVIFAGTTGNVRPWFEKSDLFMLPSKWEGMPMTLIEAMSAAMPIIASNVGGVPDMLENERSAFLIEPNADEIVEGILKLKENEALRRSLGQEAYRDSTKFKAVHMGKEYSNVFNNYPLM